MGRRRGWKVTVMSAVMLLIFTGYTSETTVLTGGEPLLAGPGMTADNAGEESAVVSAKNPSAATGKASQPGATTNERGAGTPAAATKANGGTVANPPLQPAKTDTPTSGSVKQAGTRKHDEKRVALTFDDGPDKKYTPLILEVLKKQEVKATFFVVGLQVSKYGDMLKRISEEGHAIGNHTWDHADLTKRTTKEVAEEIDKADEAIRHALGKNTDLFRAPYGATNDNVKQAVGQERRSIGWTVDTRDWAGTTPAEMLEKVKKQTKPDGIILMHCFGGKNGKLDNTIEALPQVIDYLRGEGFTFVTVPELLAEQA
ncbi:polysaccharide deacetylase family protein [Paenibacillus hodogayensis]|uniref:Polysaccharide deacetylase family protein n=1 Tax=Paenibacillus hodogayensis TaxID=279208 RepID=A0ABV5VZK7_9BACL